MSQWPFTRGLHDLGNGCFAYLQPDGTWGWSNAGLVASRGETLLIDTLMGLDITRVMLDEMRRQVPAAAHIDRLINTHANPDHVLGNELVSGAEIISGKLAAEEIARMDPAAFARMAQDWQRMGDGGEFFHETMGRQFDFSGITVRAPTRTFEGELSLQVGDKAIRLIDLGPAHTSSDTIVFVPADRTVFTGDILFSAASPIMWAGPLQNWIDACDYLLGLEVQTIIPGHGPITDKAGVRAQKRYFEHLRTETQRRFEAGLGWEEAASDIPLNEFAHWPDAERVVANVFALYREFGADLPEGSAAELFGAMGRWRKRMQQASSTRVNRRSTAKVIDIHAHLSVPAADAVLQPHVQGTPPMGFSCPESDAVNRELFARIGRKLVAVEDRIADMDARGIDIQAISPLPGQTLYGVPPEVAAAAARITNDGIASAVAKFPERLVGMGVVPLQAPDLAIAEMQRCVRQLGLRGIEISSHVCGQELADERFRPFFAAAEEMGILLFLHPLGFTHGERLRKHYLNNLLGNPIDSTIAVAHLIFAGVLDRLPGLKLCIAHGGGYTPAYWGRLDHAWRARPDCRIHISKPPSHYLRRLYFDTLVFDTAQLQFLLQTYGADHLCLGTDYPFDMSEPDPLGFHAALCDADRTEVLGGTAARLLEVGPLHGRHDATAAPTAAQREAQP